jgi:hypothetical protein
MASEMRRLIEMAARGGGWRIISGYVNGGSNGLKCSMAINVSSMQWRHRQLASARKWRRIVAGWRKAVCENGVASGIWNNIVAAISISAGGVAVNQSMWNRNE